MENKNQPIYKASASMLALAGMSIALAKVLDFIKIYQLPNGGSVTLGAMVPLMLFAILYGWKWGVAVGALYGLIEFMLNPYVVHPLQMILDYPLAFAMLGFAGIAFGNRKKFLSVLPSIILAAALRLAVHVISGCIFYSTIDFTKEGASLLAALSPSNWLSGLGYSITYNASYLIPETIVCILLIGMLWKPIMAFAERKR